MIPRRLLYALLLWCAGGAAIAQTPLPRYNVIELSAEAEREIANDLLVAELVVEDTDADAAKLAASVNRRLAQALAMAREYPAVKTRSGNHQTYPVYAPRGNVLQGWRVRADLRLETKDFDAGAALIGRLQATMQLAGMRFSVSPESRRLAENELMAEAIAAFRARAEIAQRALGARAFKIVHISIGGGAPSPRVMMAQARSAVSAEAAPVPTEGGSSRLTVQVSGAVEVE